MLKLQGQEATHECTCGLDYGMVSAVQDIENEAMQLLTIFQHALVALPSNLKTNGMNGLNVISSIRRHTAYET